MFDKDIDFDTDVEIPADEVKSADKVALASTPVDLAQLGLAEMAYVRQTTVNGEKMWTIHSAAGHPLGAAQTFDQAWGAVQQHDLTPMRVH